ncbi:MAG: alpha/beta hydrolase [Hyalangium sp.]|uniref:alpha/beta hydrolase n=1 Tax=Hyalangium sp. TaxID=2028555 RepID=UPI003899A886
MLAPPVQAGQLVHTTFHSPALEGNLLGDTADQEVQVYLPPSYARQPERRFPVLYLLHGFLSSPSGSTTPGPGAPSVQEQMDTLVQQGAIQEFIVVIPNGRNRYGGSFYMNSPVTGGWEDAIVKDLVAFVDSTYRTLARAESRGIAGHSMGGFGALRLGMRHPDVFGAVYAMSPCCLALEEDLGVDNPAWAQVTHFTQQSQLDEAAAQGMFYSQLLVAWLAAASPAPGRPPLYFMSPFQEQGGHLVPSEPAYHSWQQALVLPHVAEYREALLRLRGLAFDVGTQDKLTHIPATVRKLSEELKRLGVPHRYETYEGDHLNRINARTATHVLPFFSRVLVGSSP